MNDFADYLEKTKETGYIHSITAPVAYVSGLPGLKIEEMILTSGGKKGIVHGLNENFAEVLMIDTTDLKAGEQVTRTGKTFEIAIGKGLLGRIINPLCNSLDGLGPIKGDKEYRSIKNDAPGLKERIKIKEQLESGVMIVDILVPIGYGQRELIIGDAKSGKTTFLLQTMLSQTKKNVICIYVGIGKRDSSVKMVEEYLKKQGILEKTVIVHTTPDDSLTLGYLAPYVGISIAEYFRDKGEKTLVIFDDLTTHAKIYREISLLLKRVPGRDSYPGEIFHIQASLLERAGNIKNYDGKEVSITALPVAETLENNLSGYIQTNLMAMTDGHMFFDTTEFRRGKRPAINAFLSVSRVGNQTQSKLERELASLIRRKMAEYRRLSEVIKFGTELSQESQNLIEFNKRLDLFLNQPSENIIPKKLQLLLLGLLISGFWDNKPLREMQKEVDKIISYYQTAILPEFEEELVKEIENVEHLNFIIKELIPEIQKILK